MSEREELVQRAKECLIYANGDKNLVPFYSDIIKFLQEKIILDDLKKVCTDNEACSSCPLYIEECCLITDDPAPFVWDIKRIGELLK